MNIDLKTVLQKYPEAGKSRANLQGYLRDLYPTEKRDINLLLSVWDCGAAEEIRGMKQLDNVQMKRLVNRLDKEYGTSERFAREALTLWAEAYGVTVNAADGPSAERPEQEPEQTTEKKYTADPARPAVSETVQKPEPEQRTEPAPPANPTPQPNRSFKKRSSPVVFVLLLVAVVVLGVCFGKPLFQRGTGIVAGTTQLSSAKVGDYITFGHYEQDNNTANGAEEIEWLVLAKGNNRILVISRYGLDCKRYNYNYKGVTWENCNLRSWLNGEFLNTAFSAAEKATIPTVTVTADKNPEYDTNPGNDMQNKVFLLSIAEVNKYFGLKETRKCAPTAYAIAQGAWTSDKNTVGGAATGVWWLRSPGNSSDSAASVVADGSVNYYGNYVNSSIGVVRPALWIRY